MAHIGVWFRRILSVDLLQSKLPRLDFPGGEEAQVSLVWSTHKV